MATVKVFTPNFKHITVKITPNMTLLQILEEASRRAELDASEYDLKHHRTTMDLSSMFRFSGLPTNCELEMILAKEPRKSMDDNDVTIVLQTEEKGRLEGTFKPATTLLDIISQLCPEEADLETNPVIIYMRTDVQGANLSTTTLKTLGLTTGRGLLRLIHKSAEQLKTQANVSGNLPVKPVKEEEVAPRKKQQISAPVKPESEYKSMEVDLAVPGPSRPIEQTEPSTSTSFIPKHLPKPAKKKNIEFKKEDLDRLEGETKRLDERNTILYSLESVVNSSSDDIPDSFFDVTVGDIRVLMSQLRENSKGMDNAPLMTSKLRELEDAKKTLIQLQYKETLIRIQFPNRMVLQTVFKPIDTVAEVKQFLRTYLKEDVNEFQLFTTPPKTILEDDKRLVELHCVPQALIHLTGNETDLIKPEFMDRLSTAAAADFLAAKLRGRIEMMDNNNGAMSDKNTEDEEPMDVTSGNTDSEEPKKRIVGTFKVSSTVTTEKGAMPKWFKPAK